MDIQPFTILELKSRFSFYFSTCNVPRYIGRYRFINQLLTVIVLIVKHLHTKNEENLNYITVHKDQCY